MSSSVSVTALDLPRGFSLSLCVSHFHAEFLITTLGLVLRLVDLVLISGLLCLLHHPINFGLRQFPFHHDTLTGLIVGSTQLSMVFDETWNSSKMFSSTLTVVQSSGPSDDSLVLRPPAFSFAAWPCACCTLKHPFSDSFTSSCPCPVDSHRLLGLCHPFSHNPDSSWDCRRVLHRIPPNELDPHGPSWLAFITMYSALQVLQGGHFSSCERCSSRKTLFSCLQLGSFALRQERVLGPSDVSLSSTTRHHLLALNHEIVLVLHSSVLSQAKSVALSC